MKLNVICNSHLPRLARHSLATVGKGHRPVPFLLSRGGAGRGAAVTSVHHQIVQRGIEDQAPGAHRHRCPLGTGDEPPTAMAMSPDRVPHGQVRPVLGPRSVHIDSAGSPGTGKWRNRRNCTAHSGLSRSLGVWRVNPENRRLPVRYQRP